MSDKARALYTVDAETDPFGWTPSGKIDTSKPTSDIKPFVWGTYGQKQFRAFPEAQETLDHIGDKHAVCYAHNGGKFDYFFFLPLLKGINRLKIINGRVAEFRYNRALFRDSLNIVPVKLAAYKKDNIDYEKFTRTNRDKHITEIINYLKGDCVYLYELINAFRNQYGSKLTLAGAAMASAKEIEGLVIPKTTRGFFNAFQPFYHGGRVEAFKKGVWKSNTLSLYDFNSAYPHAMTHDHPWGPEFRVTSYLPKGRHNLSLSFIRLYADSLGAFPFVDEKGGLSFPSDGRRRLFNVTGHEYLAAMDTGTLQNPKVVQCYTFLKSINFKRYVDHYFAMKAAHKDGEPEYIFAKLMLNSLYGKFGANPANYAEYIWCDLDRVPEIENDEHPEYKNFRLVNPWQEHALMTAPIPDSSMKFYNVATAASITGFVRARLWRGIVTARNPRYCDTDAIYCDALGPEQSISKALGDFSSKGTAKGTVAIAGKKLYSIQSPNGNTDEFGNAVDKDNPPPPDRRFFTAHKGGNITPAEIVRVASGEIVHFAKLAPTFSLTAGGVYMIERNFRMT